MDDWDVRGREPTRDQSEPASAGALTAAAFVAPWVLLSFALPAPWRWKSFALLALLGLLLVLAAVVAERLARERGLDAAWWSFVTVVTFGVGMLVIYRWEPGMSLGRAQFVCNGCARIGDAREPFCFACGQFQ